MDGKVNLTSIGIGKVQKAFWNLGPAELIEHAIKNGEGFLSDKGAFTADTGKFTGRSPKDRYIVKDGNNENSIWWGDINIPFDPEKFDALQEKMTTYLSDKKVYVRDAYAGTDADYRLNLQFVNTLAWHSLFCYNMFLRPSSDGLETFDPNFTIICIPEF
jgi:phosphoenolpyruvate carboxykinase (ATP)